MPEKLKFCRYYFIYHCVGRDEFFNSSLSQSWMEGNDFIYYQFYILRRKN